MANLPDLFCGLTGNANKATIRKIVRRLFISSLPVLVRFGSLQRIAKSLPL
jgi:hypothetical protein